MQHKWKGARIEVEGAESTSIYGLHYEIDEMRSCHEHREKSDLGDEYCSGKDGPSQEATCFACRHIRGVSRLFGGWEQEREFQWYHYGTFSDDGSQFIVDKERIFGVVNRKTGGHVCTLCPAFNWSRVRSDIADLPDTIDLNESPIFQLVYSEINNKPLSIKPRQEFHYAPDAPQSFRQIPGTPAQQTEQSEHDHEDGWARDRQSEEPPKRNVPTVRYRDVAGQDTALREIKDIVQLPLTHPEYFEKVGVEPQRGVILYGPPGNGKTLIAKAVATESNAHLEIISGPEILSKWVGESEDNLREVFERARRLQPSVVLIDEIDAIAPRRDLASQQHEVTLISQLLVLLDGIEARGNVVVIATTNRIDAIDPAIRRPGRFDYHIEVPMPNDAGRKAILEACLRNMKTAPDLDLSQIACLCDGFSGAELAALCREAGLIAIKGGIAEGLDVAGIAIRDCDLTGAFQAICQKRTAI